MNRRGRRVSPAGYREVAQSVERRPYKPCDVGSSPTFPTMRRLHHAGPRKGRVYLADPRSPRGLPCRTLAGSIPTLGSNGEGGITVQKEARFGKWIYYVNDEGKARWKCSECGKICHKRPTDKQYCSWCGSKMSFEC